MIRTDQTALIEAVLSASRIVIFTGAGVSTDSGIPDYRGTGGQYSAYQPVYFQEFLADERKRREYWQHKASVWPAMRTARPGAAHRLAVRLYETGRLTGLITQNVDGLHEKSGLPGEVIVNLHGSNLEVECIDCDRRVPAGDVLDGLVHTLRGAAGEHAVGVENTEQSANLALRMPEATEIPLCPACGGYLKPATIMFGQNLRGPDLARAEKMLIDCDLLLAMGSTLMVQPAASIPVLAQQNGARLAIVTKGETPLDFRADFRIDGTISPLADAIMRTLEKQ